MLPNFTVASLKAALGSAIAVFQAGYNFRNIITSVYTQVKTGFGVLGGLVVNTGGTASTVALYNGISSVVTVSIATPGVVTWAGHPLAVGSAIKFQTTSALPTGLTAGTTYYVISAGFGANSFRVSATPGGAAVNTSGSQAGVQTAWDVSDPIGTYPSTAVISPAIGAQFNQGLIAITADGGGAANVTVLYL